MIAVMTASNVNPVFVRANLLSDVHFFVQDFETDIMPYVEHNYRVIADREHRAIAHLKNRIRCLDQFVLGRSVASQFGKPQLQLEILRLQCNDARK